MLVDVLLRQILKLMNPLWIFIIDTVISRKISPAAPQTLNHSAPTLISHMKIFGPQNITFHENRKKNTGLGLVSSQLDRAATK